MTNQPISGDHNIQPIEESARRKRFDWRIPDHRNRAMQQSVNQCANRPDTIQTAPATLIAEATNIRMA